MVQACQIYGVGTMGSMCVCVCVCVNEWRENLSEMIALLSVVDVTVFGFIGGRW